MVSVITPTTPLDDLKSRVKKEMREVLIDAAKKMGCHPEELRMRVIRNELTGAGGYEVERIPDEDKD